MWNITCVLIRTWASLWNFRRIWKHIFFCIPLSQPDRLVEGILPQHTTEVSTCGSVRWSLKKQLLSVPPWPGASTWQHRLGCEAHGGHCSHHGGALTPSLLTSVKSAQQQQLQQWALTVDQVRWRKAPCFSREEVLCSSLHVSLLWHIKSCWKKRFVSRNYDYDLC